MNSMQCNGGEIERGAESSCFARFVPLRFALPFVPRSEHLSRRKALLCTHLSASKSLPVEGIHPQLARSWPRPPVLCFLEASPIQPRTTAARLPMRPVAAQSIPNPTPPDSLPQHGHGRGHGHAHSDTAS